MAQTGKGTPRRTIRVPDHLWEAATAAAKQRGEDLSVVIRADLERYVQRAAREARKD